MEWDDLQTFLMIARHGSLTAAARALGVTQPTVGRRLATLEARAGVRLLTRTPAGYQLTPAGERVLANVERMEAEALGVERVVSGEDVRLEGEVRITTVEALAAHILVPALVGLAQRYPGIAIEIDTDTRSLSLPRREADIAVRLAEFAQHQVVVRRAGGLAFGLYASPGYLAAHGPVEYGDGLSGHALVTLQDTLRDTPEGRWFARIGGDARITLRTNSRDGQLAGVRAGLGIGCLPRYLADPAADLVRLDPPSPPPRRDIWIGVHGDTRWMPRIRVVSDHLARALAAAAPRLDPDQAAVPSP